MENSRVVLYVIAVSALLLAACEDIFEKDVSDVKLEMISPADKMSSPEQGIMFKWRENEDAERYNLQVVKGEFSAITNFYVDTLISVSRFEKVLSAGNFQWRVRIVNGSSKSEWVTRSFTIEQSKDITTVEPVLLTPENQAATNKSDVEMSWEVLDGASNYTLRVYKSGWGSELVEDISVFEGTKKSVTLVDGTYTWGVIGRNSANNSRPSTRVLTIDTKSPVASEPSTPAEGAVQTSFDVLFTWTRPTDSGSALSDSIIISKTNKFKKADIVAKALVTGDARYNAKFTEKITYYWRLKTFDKAGNSSGYSAVKSFRVSF